ncbi:PucR family transcriptional regulator [Jatrophihabitans sp.]|uniref:PucR family transcriptional regulator n=1 Tax=Jatrophihabitans sp. TaxID=1932789 RepID=UPI002C5B4503|nr:PucR family transcriptional regulator ligand-binding domain-containing protein [Jatrophihabitans sp.]
MPAAITDGVSVAQLLAAPSLVDAAVLAGCSGLERTVRGVSVLELPDIVPWVKPYELLLSTAEALGPLTDGERTADLLALIADLDARQVPGLALRLGAEPLPLPVVEFADELGFPVLRLPAGLAFEEVLAEVFGVLLDRQSQVLKQADALHQAIATIVLNGGGLPQIADEVSRLLDCVLLITTPDGRVLATEGGTGHRQGIEMADLFDASGRFLVERLRIGLQPAPDDPRGGQVAMTSIVAGGVDHGRIVAYRQPDGLPPGTVQALERVAIVAALTITKELAVSAVEGKFRGDYLRDVLTGQIPVDEPVVQHCRSLGWDIDRPMVVLVAELDAAEPSKPGVVPAGPSVVHRSQHERFVSAWQQVLRARDKAAPVVGFSHEVVALVPVRSGEASRIVAELIAAVSGDRGGGRQSFSAGVSRRVLEPAQIATGYAQARKAVSVGRRVHGNGSVSHFDSLGVHRLLSLVPDTGELKSFATEVLGDLASDAAEAADLRLTLQTLLDTNLNVAETARLLHFHYNTLRYRISKLERIVGPFTTDPHLRLDVALALQVVQMRGI